MTKKGGKRGEVQEFFLTSGYKQSAKILSIYRRHMLFVFRLFSPGHEVKPTLRLHMHSGELWRRNSSWVWRVGESLTTFPKWWMTSLIFLQPRDKTLAVVLCQTFWMSGLVQPNLRRSHWPMTRLIHSGILPQCNGLFSCYYLFSWLPDESSTSQL